MTCKKKHLREKREKGKKREKAVKKKKKLNWSNFEPKRTRIRAIMIWNFQSFFFAKSE